MYIGTMRILLFLLVDIAARFGCATSVIHSLEGHCVMAFLGPSYGMVSRSIDMFCVHDRERARLITSICDHMCFVQTKRQIREADARGSRQTGWLHML